MKIIYVAGQYTGDGYSGVESNIWKAKQASLKLYQKGWAVFTPHMNMAHLEEWEHFLGFNINNWLEIDFTFLEVAHALFMMKNYEQSAGVKKEIAHAKTLKKPIFFETDGYPKPTDIKSIGG